MAATYPRKIRVRKRGDVFIIEELVPSASGSYYVKRRMNGTGKTIREVLHVTVGLDEFLEGPPVLGPVP